MGIFLSSIEFSVDPLYLILAAPTFGLMLGSAIGLAIVESVRRGSIR